MNILKVKSCDAIATINDFINNKKHGTAYCIHDKISVFIAHADDVNWDTCNGLGYDVLETRHSGGAVVVSKGDMSVIHFGGIGNKFMENFALYLVDRYKEKGLNAVYDGNDVLIDGYKISGVSATPYEHIQYSTIHIGINTSLDDIKAICTKPMVKVPKGLCDYGITVDEVENWFMSFCENTQNEEI